MSRETVFSNANIVLEREVQHGAVLIRDGLIADVRCASDLGPQRGAVGLDDRGEIAVGKRADLVRVLSHDLPADDRHPRGRRVPVVRGVYRLGTRVS